MVRLLLRLAEHNGNRLTVPMNSVVLHDRQVVPARSLLRGEEDRRRLH